MADSATSTKRVLRIPHFTSILQGVSAEKEPYPPSELSTSIFLGRSSRGALAVWGRVDAPGWLRTAERDDHVGHSGGENVVAGPETVGNPFGPEASLFDGHRIGVSDRDV